MPPHAIELRGLEKRFPSFALGPLDLTVPVGSFYGLVGPNGSGKTTTIDVLFGMGGKDAGSITVFGLDHLRDEVAMKRQVAYVSPELNFQGWGRVGRAVDFVRGFYSTWDHEYCRRLLNAFRLDWNDPIRTLSSGARTKLALVLAMSWRPALLVLDEPTVGLDAISRRQVFAELLTAVADEGRTVFMSSHAITDLERFADHVGMLRDGKLLFEGATSELTERYRLVDLRSQTAPSFVGRPGITVQTHEGDRWRVLVDAAQIPLTDVTRAPATVQCISESAVSLEELFIALGQA